MADDDADVIWNRDVFNSENRAVDQGRVTRPCARDAQLVHDAGGYTSGFVLGALAEFGKLERRATEADRHCDGDFQGGTRRETRTHRDGRRHSPLDTDRILDQIEHRFHIATPWRETINGISIIERDVDHTVGIG